LGLFYEYTYNGTNFNELELLLKDTILENKYPGLIKDIIEYPGNHIKIVTKYQTKRIYKGAANIILANKNFRNPLVFITRIKSGERRE